RPRILQMHNQGAGDHVGDVDDLEGVDTRAVLPDTTGAVVVQFGLNADGGVNFFKLPVVAWKYKGHGGADPITVKSLSGVWCLELKVEGHLCWVFPEDQSCETFELALKVARKKLQAIQAVKPKDFKNTA